jgi:hypothetical protein
MTQYLAAAIGSQALNKLRRVLTDGGKEIDDYTESR